MSSPKQVAHARHPSAQATAAPVHNLRLVARRARSAVLVSRPSATVAAPARPDQPVIFLRCHTPPTARAGLLTTADNTHRPPAVQPGPHAEWRWPVKYAGYQDGSCRCPDQNVAPVPTRHQSPRAHRRWSNWFRRCWWPIPLCGRRWEPVQWQHAERSSPVRHAAGRARCHCADPRHLPVVD